MSWVFAIVGLVSLATIGCLHPSCAKLRAFRFASTSFIIATGAIGSAEIYTLLVARANDQHVNLWILALLSALTWMFVATGWFGLLKALGQR